MDWSLHSYALTNSAAVLTPSLLIYPERVQANIDAAISFMGGDAGRWRPHVKTTKCSHVVQMLIQSGVRACKCATTLELLMCCEEEMPDVLFAMPLAGPNARRVGDIARSFGRTCVSVLVESQAHLETALDQGLDVFVDVNPGMNRTGISPERSEEIRALATAAGSRFRGLHYYDGHLASGHVEQAQAGYAKLLDIVTTLGLPVGEVITSGTPATLAGLRFEGFAGESFIHRVSPGTIVFNDLSSLQQIPDQGFAAAALVLATVVSHPAPGIITCDAGHKAVSVDSGVPNCQVLGQPELEPLKPSEEHLPIRVPEGARTPAIGEAIYLLPKHICPTVNLFDEAVAVRGGAVAGVWRIRARGHEPACK